MTCLHAWCIRADHDEDPSLHQGAPALVAGVDEPAFPAPQVTAKVTYCDGDRLAHLLLSAGDVLLTPAATADLIDVLEVRLAQMLAVQAVPQAVAR